MPGRHEAPKQSDPFIGLVVVVLALLVLPAVVIILSVA
jgi:hypothetical protein